MAACRRARITTAFAHVRMHARVDGSDCANRDPSDDRRTARAWMREEKANTLPAKLRNRRAPLRIDRRHKSLLMGAQCAARHAQRNALVQAPAFCDAVITKKISFAACSPVIQKKVRSINRMLRALRNRCGKQVGGHLQRRTRKQACACNRRLQLSMCSFAQKKNACTRKPIALAL
jgi:hypothetical protein